MEIIRKEKDGDEKEGQLRGFLDTSVVVRYLTGSPPETAAEAVRIIHQVDDLQITDIVLTETAYVLRSHYQVSRETMVDRLIDLVQRDNIATYAMDKNRVLEGLRMCRPSGRVSIADAMIWAAAQTDGASVIYTFDERFPSDGMALRRRL